MVVLVEVIVLVVPGDGFVVTLALLPSPAETLVGLILSGCAPLGMPVAVVVTVAPVTAVLGPREYAVVLAVVFAVVKGHFDCSV